MNDQPSNKTPAQLAAEAIAKSTKKKGTNAKQIRHSYLGNK